MNGPTLKVENLHTHFFTQKGVVKAVDGVSFEVARGEVLGLVGKSGSGKTITGFSILDLVDPPGRVTAGRILFQGQDIVGLPSQEMRSLRGRRIAMIFQDPMMTLNPVLSIETQMVETILAHENVSRKEARARSRDALGMVGIPSPDERLASYPHQFSGGMRQRAAIAIALLHRPELIIADEPTTALDVTIQSQILAQMQGLTKQFGMALLWISHDLGVVAGLAHRVAVMYAGRIVEIGPTDDVLDHPTHPYTIGLLQSVPANVPRGSHYGLFPAWRRSPLQRPSGCPFRERCAFADRRSAGRNRRSMRTVRWHGAVSIRRRGSWHDRALDRSPRRCPKRFVRGTRFAEKLARMLGAQYRSPAVHAVDRCGSRDHARARWSVWSVNSAAASPLLGRSWRASMPPSDGEICSGRARRRTLAPARGAPRALGRR